MTGLDLDATEWAAARLAAGERVPDAGRAAYRLAARATRAGDRSVMDDLTDDQDRRHVPSGKTGPRVSDAGACPRSVWYRESPPAGYEPWPVDRRRAAIGVALHKAAERARAYRYPWRRYELEIGVPGLDRPGRVDEYDPVLGEVTDLKTVGARKWDALGEDGGPTPDMWAQVMIYALALAEQGLPVRAVRIIAVNRDTAGEEHYRRDYDPAAGQAALDALVMLATQLDMGWEPDRPDYAVGPGVFPCSWCPARGHCWNIKAAKAAGRSPESYTLLGAEPDDPSIEWAARRHHEATRAATAADATKKAAAALLVGIPSGTYGGMTVAIRRRRMPDYKNTLGRVLGLYPLPEVYRPPVEAIEEPDTRLDVWIESKPVRQGRPARTKGKT